MMFTVERPDIDAILKDFGISREIEHISELERYHYERDDPDSKEVRLILKADLVSGPSLVMRFKNEADVTLALIEAQSRFADVLGRNGILTPRQYQSNGAFARWYEIGGYDVIVTVEQFAENEIRSVDAAASEKTGELLARMHCISERLDLHVQNKVLFDPFSENDLFDIEAFQSIAPSLDSGGRALFDQILAKYHAYMELLAPLKGRPRYAVQGDISDCNLYQAPSGEIGIFDFNRCGDNELFCDTVMQAVFESRLMDYPEDAPEDNEAIILSAFLRGYRSVRAFSDEQQRWYPYLYAVIGAFWSLDIKWREDSLLNVLKKGDMERVGEWLEIVWKRITCLDRSIEG